MQRGLVSVGVVFSVACGASPDPAPAHPASGALAARVEPAGRGHALVVENGSSAPARLLREIVVEREASGGWEHVEASWLLLRASCDENDPPACIEIAPGATLRAAPWIDMIGDAQCACEECGPAGAGHYRMAITPCDGGARLETASFDVE